MIDLLYINSILAKFEGKAIARGYIPCKSGTYYGGDNPDKGEPLGASGITIATGVDLGQQTRLGLSEMGVSDETLHILDSYIGLKKMAAWKKLKSAPFTLTVEQVEEIDQAVHQRYINQTADLFGKKLFEAVPKQVQAVAVSLHYQFGTPAREASPGLGLAWEAMRSGDYGNAADFLTAMQKWSTDHRQYMGRRKQEAALLKEIT